MELIHSGDEEGPQGASQASRIGLQPTFQFLNMRSKFPGDDLIALGFPRKRQHQQTR